MARYLFITWNGSGNQNPTLGAAQALCARGDDIAFAGYASQQERIAGHGFRFAVLERSDAALRFPAGGDLMAALVAGVWVTPAHLDDVRDAAAREAPDLLVIDCLMFGALAAAELHHLPTVVLVHSAPGLLAPPDGPFERFLLREPINALRTAAGLPPVATVWENWARFPTLCASLPILDPLAATAPQTFTYVGPLQEEMPPSGWHLPWPADDQRPLVLVSFSSGAAWDQTSRIQRTLDGLAGQPVRVLVTAGTADISQLTIPANAIVIPFVPHEEILPQMAAVVTHAGHGTVTAALAYGLPLVCLPNLAADQPAVAAQVAALGAGIALDGDSAPPENIGDAVMATLTDPSYASAARRLADV
ncbi:MAG TPA: glycosyltransferase, partial [Ktedonobacterales bacterium]|nr:glycosyltransferase [Ktedonobacterales bacterium]